MAAYSPSPEQQEAKTQTGAQHQSSPALTEEQVRVIADRVYSLLLRDLKYERERDRIALWNSGSFKRG